MRIFELDAPVDGYTHGEVYDEKREHSAGMLVVAFHYGTMDGKDFIPSSLGNGGSLTMSVDDMTDLRDATTGRPADLPAYEFRTGDVIEFLPTLMLAREAAAAAAAEAKAAEEAAAAVAAAAAAVAAAEAEAAAAEARAAAEEAAAAAAG